MQISKAELLQQCGADAEPLADLGRRIGVDALEQVLVVFGGSQPYIPTPAVFWEKMQRPVRDAEIYDRFRGNNYADLAAEYGLSEKQVRNIINRMSHRTPAAA